ncbi:MAG: radical SAM protein [Acidobacteria bacterium]|nr:radical SAM protein [Acidobacteriota bacterium]
MSLCAPPPEEGTNVKYGFSGRLKAEFPSQVIVDNTELCNLTCIHCAHPVFKKSRFYAGRSLDPALNAKLVDEVREHGRGRTRYIRYTSEGEPLLDPNRFVMLARAVRASGVTVTLTTNGTLLNEKRAERLFGTGVHVIDVSIDAFTPETQRIPPDAGEPREDGAGIRGGLREDPRGEGAAGRRRGPDRTEGRRGPRPPLPATNPPGSPDDQGPALHLPPPLPGMALPDAGPAALDEVIRPRREPRPPGTLSPLICALRPSRLQLPLFLKGEIVAKPGSTRLKKQIATTRRSLKSLERSLYQLASMVSTEASDSTRPRLSAKGRAALVLQGRYMGYVRQLQQAQKARVRKIRETRGVRAAIQRARQLVAG